jgi:hypothetical protein
MAAPIIGARSGGAAHSENQGSGADSNHPMVLSSDSDGEDGEHTTRSEGGLLPAVSEVFSLRKPSFMLCC